MFDKKLWWTGAALAVTAIVTTIFLNLPVREEAVPMQEPVSDVRQEQSAPPPREPEEAEAQWAYLLKEHEGRIAVFTPGAEEPQMVFDVLVKFLPDYDRIQMKQGIPVQDFAALSAMIEDYIS